MSTAGATAAVENGQLVLESPMVPVGAAIALEQDISDADFDVTFQVSAVTLGGPGAYVRATISSATGSTYVGARQTMTELLLESETVPIGIRTSSPTVAQLMTLHFARAADKFEARATAGDEAAGISDRTFADSPLTLRLELGGTEANASATSARFESFDVAAGTIAADAFDCDSLVQ